MNAPKPENWATRRPLPAGDSPLPPDVDPELIAWLRKMYPPQCYDPHRQTLEDHLLYAGRVALIEEMASFMKEREEGQSQDELIYEIEREAMLADNSGDDNP